MAKGQQYLDVESAAMHRDDSSTSLGSSMYDARGLRNGSERPWDECSVATSQIPFVVTEDQGSDDEPERGNWTGRFDFLLSLLGYSVGLGNVWRFPYLCYKNGGGAFLVPFVLMLLAAGLPLMFMELSLGQYASLGPIALYAEFSPLMHGLGWAMVLVSAIVMLYYNMIIAWTIYYMCASLGAQLPWTTCDAAWSTVECYSYSEADACTEKNGTYYNRTCMSLEELAVHNVSIASIANMTKQTPAEEYFNNFVLALSSGIEDTGAPKWQLLLCLLVAWIIVFLCLSKGVQTSGKVVYFTALFPYVVLLLLFFRGITLPGAGEGILWYLTPDLSKLGDAKVWGEAAVQIFFALSPAWGGLITLSSYNKFHNNCYQDALIVSVSNILTSIFAGFVIFSVIGFLAHELNVDIDKVVKGGPGLAFVVYPEVVSRLPLAPLWSFMFFFMLLTLGLDSQFALMETVTTAILDGFPLLRERKVATVAGVSVLGFLGGVIFTTPGGAYWLELLDTYAANWSVLLIAITECLLVAWHYGAPRFLGNVTEMIGKKSKLWIAFWSLMWKYVSPTVLVFILVSNWIEYKPVTMGDYVFPLWANVIGWCCSLFPVCVVLAIALHKLLSYDDSDSTFANRLWATMKPTALWGPQSKRILTKRIIRNSSAVYNANNGVPGMVTSVSGTQISLPTNGLNHELPSIPEFHVAEAEDDDDDDEDNRAPMFTAKERNLEGDTTATEDDSTADKPLMMNVTRI